MQCTGNKAAATALTREIFERVARLKCSVRTAAENR
jgi:hypothetical protein